MFKQSMIKQRASEFELLRLFCIIGIVIMHTFGIYHDSATGSNLVWGVVESSIFNMGVTIFMLISGYFGIDSDIKKIVRLECVVLFYSLLSEVIAQHIGGGH